MSVSDVWDVPCARQRVEFDHRSYLEGGVKDFPLAPLSLRRCLCQQGIIVIMTLFTMPESSFHLVPQAFLLRSFA